MNSKVKNLFINCDLLKKETKISNISNIPYKRKDVKINTSSKSKVKILGRRDK